MNSNENTSTQTPIAAKPSLAVDKNFSHQEVSHVFNCMQCELQFQLDLALTGQNGSYQIDTRLVYLREPLIELEQED